MDPYERYNYMCAHQLEKAMVCIECVTYALPPMRRCFNFHTFCNSCAFRLIGRNCPKCEDDHPLDAHQRNEVLEDFRQYVSQYCNYPSCDLRMPSKIIPDHEFFCKHGNLPCPMEFSNCRWQGPAVSFFDHCYFSHGLNNNATYGYNHITPPDRSYTYVYAMIEFYKRQYKLIVQCFNNKSRFCVFELHPEIDRVPNYEFIVEFRSNNSDERLAYQETCPIMDGREPKEYLFQDPYFINIPSDILSPLRHNTTGDLQFSVNLVPISTDRHNEISDIEDEIED